MPRRGSFSEQQRAALTVFEAAGRPLFMWEFATRAYGRYAVHSPFVPRFVRRLVLRGWLRPAGAGGHELTAAGRQVLAGAAREMAL